MSDLVKKNQLQPYSTDHLQAPEAEGFAYFFKNDATFEIRARQKYTNGEILEFAGQDYFEFNVFPSQVSDQIMAANQVGVQIPYDPANAIKSFTNMMLSPRP